MMKKLNNLVPLRIKYLFFFSSIIIVPFMVIMLYFYPTVVKYGIETKVNSKYAFLEQIKNNIDQKIVDLYSLPVLIHSNPQQNVVTLLENGYTRMYMQQEFAKYIAVNSFIDAGFFHVKGSKYITSINTTYNTKQFGEVYFKNTSLTQQQLLYMLDNNNGVIVRGNDTIIKYPDNIGEKYISFILSVPVNNKYSYATIYLLVKESSFINTESISEDSSDNIIITSEEGNVIYATDYENAQYLLDIFHNSDGTDKNYTEDGYYITYINSQETDWNYYYFSTAKELNNSLQKVRRNMIALIIAFVVAELLLIYIAVKLNFKPISQLFLMIEKHSAFEKNHKLTLKESEKKLSEVFVHQEEMEHNLNKTIKHDIVSNIISGLVKNWDEYLEYATANGVDFINKKFNIIMFSFEKEITRSEWEGLYKLLESHQWSNSRHYMVLEVVNRIFYVVVAHDGNNIGLLKKDIEDVNANIENTFAIKPRSILSPVIMDYKELNNGIIQLKRIFSYITNSEYNNQGLIYVDDVNDQLLKDYKYPSHIITNINIAINQRNIEDFRDAVEKLVKFMSHDIPTYVLRTIYFECLGLFKKELISMNINIQTYITISRSEIIEYINKYSNILIDHYTKNIDAKNDDETIIAIFAYIEGNYRNYDFSLSKVAEIFQMSQSNFSHYFTRKTGYNFLKYVNILKVKKAKELLDDTDMTIINIAKELGYETDTAFTKMFKKQTGQTPGKYREKRTIK